MSLIKRIIIRIRCKEHEYETITNLHGDMINQYRSLPDGSIVRSIKRCKICGKEIKSPALDPDCNTVNFTMKKCEGCIK